jgi:YjbE family integral membrane protein
MNMFLFVSMTGEILLLDLLLSGDNALVIGVAAAGLARRQRWYAIAVGGAMAMLLRILFTALASTLLNIPFIQTIGAGVLLYLACNLLQQRTQIGAHVITQQLGESSVPGTRQPLSRFSNAFLSALLNILIADVTMSLDNILAVGALANGEVFPLLIGLVGSIIVLMLGSAIVSILVERLRWLLDVAALILAWTSATMIHDDLTLLATSQHLATHA